MKARSDVTISIITATYNVADTVVDCLNSIKAQTLPLEHIVVDGGSVDETLEIVRTVSPRSFVISEPDNGIYDAMNKGIRLATGDVVGILNSDDFYTTPEVMTKVAEVFDDQTVMSCYGDLEYVRVIRRGQECGAAGRFAVVRHWRSGRFNCEKFKWGWMPPHPTFFVRRSVYERFGGFRLDMGSAADYELMLRLLFKHRITSFHLPEVLVRMRIGGVSNATLAHRLLANRMDRRAWHVNGLRPYPWTLLFKPVRKLPQYFVRVSIPPVLVAMAP
ncbi:glycosyl transferase [Desulfofustis limnaeus]|uniref:Glycosyl transferase n=1 Tax=Desulfofustis limnaeus TaxID=2740163 RepID=A0ABM7W9M7_9BACT|nr:glycosyl transferase [Desulfofustis limnaeus]